MRFCCFGDRRCLDEMLRTVSKNWKNKKEKNKWKCVSVLDLKTTSSQVLKRVNATINNNKCFGSSWLENIHSGRMFESIRWIVDISMGVYVVLLHIIKTIIITFKSLWRMTIQVSEINNGISNSGHTLSRSHSRTRTRTCRWYYQRKNEKKKKQPAKRVDW